MKNRMNSVDCLRVILMLFIVIHHCIVSGLGLNESLNSGMYVFNCKNVILVLMNSFVIIAVNIFFLISGYFTITYKKEKLLKLLGEILFYSGTIYLISIVMGNEQLNVKGLIRYSILSLREYWFMEVYVILMVLSPFLNLLIDKLINDMEKYKIFIIVMILICCGYGFLFESPYIGTNKGYSLIYAVLLYFTGNYIKHSKKSEESMITKCTPISVGILYVGIAVINAFLAAIVIKMNYAHYAWKLFSYNNILIYLESISFFIMCVFRNNISKFENKISKYGKHTLGIYLIHSCSLLIPYRFEFLEKVVNNNAAILMPVFIIVYCCLLYIICMFIEILRSGIAKSIGKKLKKLK